MESCVCKPRESNHLSQINPLRAPIRVLIEYSQINKNSRECCKCVYVYIACVWVCMIPHALKPYRTCQPVTWVTFWWSMAYFPLTPTVPSVLPSLFFSLCPTSFADGCPNLCNGNGQCTMGQNSWHCECKTGWRGTGCNVAMETSCADNKDNEGGQTAPNSPAQLTLQDKKKKKHKSCFTLIQ